MLYIQNFNRLETGVLVRVYKYDLRVGTLLEEEEEEIRSSTYDGPMCKRSASTKSIQSNDKILKKSPVIYSVMKSNVKITHV